MAPTASTLIAVSLLGLMFNSTRWMGITAVARLIFRYPVPSLVALSIGLTVFIFIKFFR